MKITLAVLGLFLAFFCGSQAATPSLFLQPPSATFCKYFPEFFLCHDKDGPGGPGGSSGGNGTAGHGNSTNATERPGNSTNGTASPEGSARVFVVPSELFN
ncbi:uncharacterized protein LOC119557034 [Drosophila subpulchrella]|uniref:uncharacterized protein LOC119557034 n=1 Tax=Drosophila subpulchrella TaxID=1486046 RepID=UPI0018A12D69|nr:uncharacterized protein LOC119557034 [Drosophila subpulchrella]